MHEFVIIETVLILFMVLVYFLFQKHFLLFWSQDSSFGTVTRSLAGRSGIQMVAGGEDLSFLQKFQPALVEEMQHAQIDRQTEDSISHTRVPFTLSAILCPSF